MNAMADRLFFVLLALCAATRPKGGRQLIQGEILFKGRLHGTFSRKDKTRRNSRGLLND